MLWEQETITEVLSILVNDLSYEFTGDEGVRNKEAVILIADLYNVLPKDVNEFFRYIIYRASGETLLIKNKDLIQKIKSSSFNPTVQFNQFGLDKLAQIFNRYKPLFLAFKGKSSKTINKISKLSKKNHKAMPVNPLNEVTVRELLLDDDIHWLENATPFALFKALSACYSRKNGQDTFVYRVRNGKSFVKKGNPSVEIAKKNYKNP